MMMPSLSTSSSSVSATIRVDKATSELLAAPDWSMNLEICDLCNSNNWLAKDVVKEVKRRLQNKNPKVQLLTLTLLETMVKNCGEYIHFHIAERKILDELIKIVKKKGDMHVRDRILILIDSWQEAFGGPGGKYSQYYWACDELRRCGVHFPQRSQRSAPIITPPVTHQPRASIVGSGMPPNSSRRLEEAMTSEVEGLSFSTLESMRNLSELLADMLQAVNPTDRMAVKDEIIVDLVDRARSNQKKLMQMITTTTDEELLARGLEMNDSLQSVLAKHDAIASGAPLPNHRSLGDRPSESVDSSLKTSEAKDKNPAPNGKSTTSSAPVAEEDEEEDEFAQLARRHSKTQSTPSQSTALGTSEDAASSSSSNSNALVLIDAPAPEPAPVTTSKEQDLIDLLSIVLTSPSPAETPQAPTSAPAENSVQDPFNSYVVPWANPQTQLQAQQQLQSIPQYQAQYQTVQPQLQPQLQQGYSHVYPPPPWEATSGYNSYPQNLGSNPYVHPSSQGIMNGSSTPMQVSYPSQNFASFQTTQYGNQPIYPTSQTTLNSPGRSLQHSNSFQSPNMNGSNTLYPNLQGNTSPSSMSMNGARSLQHVNSFPARTANGSATMTNGISAGQQPKQPFIPSYRLFEDLNVLGSSEGKLKNGPYPSASGNPNQNMIAGRR